MFENIKKAFGFSSFDYKSPPRNVFVSGGDKVIFDYPKSKLLAEIRNEAYTCIDLTATKFADYEPRFYVKRGDEEVVIEDHPLSQILRRPNDMLTLSSFMYLWSTYYDAVGASYIYVPSDQGKGAKQMFLLRPDMIEPYFKGDENQDGKIDAGELLGYFYISPEGEPVFLETWECFMSYRPNPEDFTRPLGTLEAGMLYVDNDNALHEMQNTFVRKGGHSTMLINVNDVDELTFEKMKSAYKNRHSGVQSTGQALWTRNGETSISKIGLGLEDIDISNLSDLNTTKIHGLFGIHPAMLAQGSGLADSIGPANQIFMQNKIDPRQTMFDQVLETIANLLFPYKEQVYVNHISKIPEDIDTKLAIASQLGNTYFTLNEVREMFDMPRIEAEGADDVLAPFNLVSRSKPKEPTPILDAGMDDEQ